jgi:GAF domain-containing protein
MSMAPVPGIILDLIATLNQGVQVRQPFDSTLKQALNVLVRLWPGVEAARLYDQHLSLIAATDQAADLLDIAEAEQVMAGLAPVFNESRAAWWVPLAVTEQPAGMLEIVGDLPEDEGTLALVRAFLVQALGSQTAVMIAQQNFYQQFQDLNRLMVEADDVLDLLHAVRRFTTNASRIIHQNVIYDDQGQITDLIVRHVLNFDQEQVLNTSVAQFESADLLANNIEYWQQASVDDIIFISDTSQPPADFPAAIAHAAEYLDIGSYILMPILRDGRLQDIIRVDYPTKQSFTLQLRQLFDAARHQVTLIFQLLDLIQQERYSAFQFEQQVTVLQTMNSLSTAISITKDERQLLNQSAQAFVEVLKADYCRVYLLDASNQGGSVFCEYPNRGTTGQPFTLADLPVTNTPDERNPMPLVVSDAQTDPRVSTRGRETFAAGGVKAFALMPLFVRGRLVGLFQVEINHDDYHFTPESQELMQTVLAQVSVGLQNIRLLENAQQNSDQLERANRFGQALQSSLDLEVILRAALTESHRVIPVERMSIALKSVQDTRLRVVGLYANGENYITLTNGAEVALEDSLVGDVWESQQATHIPDVTEYETHPTGDFPELKSMLILPLVSHGEALGIVQVGYRQAYVYNETDVIVFQQMMAQFAAAIENAQLYDYSQRRAHNEALVNEIAAQLQRQTDIESMLVTTASGLGGVLGARRARIRLSTRTTGRHDGVES